MKCLLNNISCINFCVSPCSRNQDLTIKKLQKKDQQQCTQNTIPCSEYPINEISCCSMQQKNFRKSDITAPTLIVFHQKLIDTKLCQDPLEYFTIHFSKVVISYSGKLCGTRTTSFYSRRIFFLFNCTSIFNFYFVCFVVESIKEAEIFRMKKYSFAISLSLFVLIFHLPESPTLKFYLRERNA